MNKFYQVFLLILFSSIITFAQTPKTTPVENDDDVVKISTNLIQIDVTVTDKKGNPVKDLKPADFEIYENGKRQDISGFSFVSNQRIIQSENRNDHQTPTAVRPEQVRRTIALVVDDLSLSYHSVYYVRRALKKFVDEQMQDGDLVAIVRTGSGIGALQQFTTDRRQLYAAIEKIQWNSRGTGSIGAFAPIDTGSSDTVDRNLNSGTINESDILEEINQKGIADTEIYNYQESLFATGTLGAIDYIIRGMRELPGRKSVMLMSDGFKFLTQKPRGFVETNRVFDSLQRLTDLASRSSVVIYTMDARGLQTTSITAEDNVGTAGSQFSRRGSQEGLKTGGGIPTSLRQDRASELRASQDGLIYLARETGGLALTNNSDLNFGIRRMLDDQSYYLIAYEPDDETFDPKKRQFNKLEIKVNRKDTEVRYRSGFFGVSDEKIAAQKSNLSPQQQLVNSLTSPFSANDISLRLNTLFGNDGETGSFVRSLVNIDTKGLKFSDEPDGTKKAVFDVFAASFGDNGIVIDQIGTTYTLNVKKEVYQKFLDEGFIYYFSFPIKKPGVYQYRVGVMDGKSKQIGSASQLIEVPNLENKRLTLSGVMLENLTQKQWQNRLNNSPESQNDLPNPLLATSLRRFKTGTILRYGFQIYNPKPGNDGKPNLSVKIRLLREGKLMLDGKVNPVELDGQTDFKRISYSGGFGLGDDLMPGEYILQISITDNLSKEKQKLATQFLQFEIVK